MPFEDSYFPDSHSCHTRPPAILRLSLHCGNHNYTCGCLLIAARSLARLPDPSPAHPSRIRVLLSSSCPLLQLLWQENLTLDALEELALIPIREISITVDCQKSQLSLLFLIIIIDADLVRYVLYIFLYTYTGIYFFAVCIIFIISFVDVTFILINRLTYNAN